MIDIRVGDCFDLIKDIPTGSVDLIVTSPPYADIVSYGNDIDVKRPNEYVDWLLPLFNEIYRVLKPTGSFILNINHNVKNGVVNPFVYDLISRSQKETKLKLYADYYWHKRNGIPNGSNRRFRNTTEFIFHFVKDPKQTKFYMDRVLQEPAESYAQRQKYPWSVSVQGTTKDRVRDNKKKVLVSKSNELNIPTKVRPDNVFRFYTAGKARDNHIKHPAPFHKELPEYFINLLTDEGDLVIDVFSGIGTTGLACNNRNYIGFELNEKYAEFSKKRLSGQEGDFYQVCQYDLEGNLIARYDNRDEASRATGVESGDIMRTYNRTKFNSRGGFIWKLEKKV